MKNIIGHIGLIGLILFVALAAKALPFTYSITNNTLNGVDLALYESNSPGNYTFQTEQLVGTNLVLVLTNSLPQATNGIALQFTNHNSFSLIGYLNKFPQLPAGGCNVSVLITNYFTRFNMASYANGTPGVYSGNGSQSTNAPQVNTNVNVTETIISADYAQSAGFATNAGTAAALSGEIDGTLDKYPATNISLTVSCAQDGNSYNLIQNAGVPVVDDAPGFYEGEIVIWTNASGLAYQVFTNGVLYLGPQHGSTYDGLVTENPLPVSGPKNGTSSYTFVMTGTANEVFALRQMSGTPSLLKGINGAVGPNGFSLGFDSDGSYGDLNLKYNGVTRVKIAANGNIMFNAANSNNVFAATPSGFIFGNGSGGQASTIGTNGTFTTVTNTTIQSGSAGKSIMTIVNGTNFWVNDKGGGIFATNHVP